MSFGQKILEKYGFKQGSGLGKNENGITEPIKANYKFDNTGLGDKGPVREDHWWERVFNEASSNVNVKTSEKGNITVDLHDKDGVEITNKSFSMKKIKDSNTTLQYGSFLKSATLLANVGKEEDIEGHTSTNDIEIKPTSVLSDEDLFKACQGRTAHKGARHGLKLSGKLKRIAAQEKELLERMKGKQNKHEVFQEEPATKKLKKNPLVEFNSSKDESSDELPVDTESDYILKASKKRRRRDRRQEAHLAEKINGIGLKEKELGQKSPIKSEEDDEPYNGTPVRKKKMKSKQTFEKLLPIQEDTKVRTKADKELSKESKKKKGKRKLDEDLEMPETKYTHKKSKAVTKPKRVKLNSSYEASDDEEDVVEKINAEQDAIREAKRLKKSSKRIKKRVKGTANYLAKSL